MNLSVDVGFGHMVEVDQGDMPNAAAGKGLSRPGPYPANADHHHMGLLDALRPCNPIQPLQPPKTASLICD